MTQYSHPEKGKFELAEKLRTEADRESIINMIHMLLERITNLTDKIEQLDKRIVPLNQSSEMRKQINDIYRLHFAAKHFKTPNSLKDTYLAEILIGGLRKRG